MGFFDKQRERANYEQQALTALGELRIKSISSRSRLSPWQSACGMLERFYTREAAAQDSIKARCRVDSLKVPEPQPLLEDFVPPNIPSSLPEAGRMFADMQFRFEAALRAHPQREQLRLNELRAAESMYEQAEARERTERLERQLRRWPKGVTLDPDIASIDGIEPQVRAQNCEIERQVAALSNLLADGLDALPAGGGLSLLRASILPLKRSIRLRWVSVSRRHWS
jgi:hypothetical protein